MDIKQELRALLKKSSKIDVEVAELNKLCERLSVLQRQATSYRGNDFKDLYNRKFKLETKIEHDIDSLADEKEDIKKTVEDLDGERYVVVAMRYFAEKSWLDIATFLHYSVRQVHRIHQKALDDLREKTES